MDFKFILHNLLSEKQYENFFVKPEHTKLEISELRIFMEESTNVKSKLRKEIGLRRSVDKQGSSLRLFYQHNSCSNRAHYEEYVNWQKLDYRTHYEQIIRAIKKHFGPKAKRSLLGEKRFSIY